jgi:hypothetical protein
MLFIVGDLQIFVSFTIVIRLAKWSGCKVWGPSGSGRIGLVLTMLKGLVCKMLCPHQFHHGCNFIRLTKAHVPTLFVWQGSTAYRISYQRTYSVVCSIQRLSCIDCSLSLV